MKRFIFLTALFTLVLNFFLFAQSETDFSFNGGIITGYTGSSKEVVIPTTINGTPVTEIGSYAFRSKQLTSVVIPNSVTKIDESAFERNQLTHIVIPGNLYLFNDRFPIAFDEDVLRFDADFVLFYYAQGKRAGTYLLIDDEWYVTDYGLSRTDAYAKLNPVTISEDDFDIKQLPDGTLSITKYLAATKNVAMEIPATISGVKVTVIEAKVFENKNIVSVVIPDSVTTIGDSAFAENPLTSVTIGKGVKKIGDRAFLGKRNTKLAPSLGTLVIPNAVTDLGYGAFTNCGITSLTLGNGLVTIGDQAFSGNRITELTIPTSVRSIGRETFSDNQIETLNISNGVTVIGVGAFQNNKITTLVIPGSLRQFSEENSYRKTPALGLQHSGQSILAGVSVTTVFSGNPSFTRITVPANMDEGNFEGFPEAFVNFWKSQNKAAGTYFLNGRLWAKE